MRTYMWRCGSPKGVVHRKGTIYTGKTRYDHLTAHLRRARRREEYDACGGIGGSRVPREREYVSTLLGSDSSLVVFCIIIVAQYLHNYN